MFHHGLRNLKNACLKRNIRKKKVILRCIPIILLLSNGIKSLTAHTHKGAERHKGRRGSSNDTLPHLIPGPPRPSHPQKPMSPSMKEPRAQGRWRNPNNAVREPAPARPLRGCPRRPSAPCAGDTHLHGAVGAALQVTLHTGGATA